MPSSRPPPSLSRRAVLAAGGAALIPGCSEVASLGASKPPIECGQRDYDWPMHGYDAASTRYKPTGTLPPDAAGPRRLADPDTGDDGVTATDAPPVVSDGVAYVAGLGRVAARDVQSGELLWATDVPESVHSSPALACGTVYVSGSNATVALDMSDGTILWRADVAGSSDRSASPVAIDDRVYVVGGEATAFDARTGEIQWTVGGDKEVHGVAVADCLYAGVGRGLGSVAAYTRDGEEWWHTFLSGETNSAPTVAGDAVYAVSTAGTLHALSAADGSVRWTTDVEPDVDDGPAVADGRVFVGAGEGERLMAFDAASGDRLWTFRTGPTMGGPVVVGDRVVAPGANTGIHALDAATGERVRHWPEAIVGSQPTVADGRIFYRSFSYPDTRVIG